MTDTPSPDAPSDRPAAPVAPLRDDAVARSAQRLAQHVADAGLATPRVAVLLGSGWGPVADRVTAPADLPYEELPAFPVLAIEGHAGVLRLGRLAGVPLWVLRGRKHTYEDGDAAAMKGAIRTLAAAGVAVLVQTNAAGSLVRDWRPGQLMAVADHLNLVQRSPLVGERGASRFVDMAAAYDAGLRALARTEAARRGLALHEGVYAWVLGPQFETPAEVRMIAALGAHAVGMSTVPETLVARHAGLRVLAVSMLTNMGCGLEDEALSHAHTLKTAATAAGPAADWIEAVVGAIGRALEARA